MSTRWLGLLTAGLAVAAGTTSSSAAEQSGIAVAVIPAAQVAGEAGSRALRTQAPVFMGDVIATGAAGEAQVRLLDDTKLVVGPNSRIEIDRFVYRGGGSAQEVSLNAVRGAFRFITGKSQKNAYTIRTPTATIGVRGTEFDFNVDSRGGMAMALYDGWAKICDQQGRRCVDVWGACSVAVAPPQKRAQRVTSLSDRADQLEAFPYVASQARLHQEFRVDTSSCGVRRAGAPRQGGSTPAPIQNAALPPANEDPPDEGGGGGGGNANNSGLSDGTNPGKGAGRSNASNSGSNNPGGGNN